MKKMARWKWLSCLLLLSPKVGRQHDAPLWNPMLPLIRWYGHLLVSSIDELGLKPSSWSFLLHLAFIDCGAPGWMSQQITNNIVSSYIDYSTELCFSPTFWRTFSLVTLETHLIHRIWWQILQHLPSAESTFLSSSWW